ncbi:MAG: hypothetical protein LBK94_11380 [Prevotellaceae bacterium]|jgi:hypothetical protein|nr:hypothetical protein [Prevotellaceae bacterium]
MKHLKTKIPAGKIAKYLRELSVVVIGIAITLSVNSWLTTRNEKKDMALYLNAVKLELETNLVNIKWLTGEVEKEVGYSRYLLSHDKNALDPDSIRFYESEHYSIRGVIAKFNAFDMFKASGSMRYIKGKEVLVSIWDAYSDLETYKLQLMDYHNKEKYEEGKREMQLKQEGKPIAVPMYGFYTSQMKYTFDMLDGCKRAVSALENAIEKIETVL